MSGVNPVPMTAAQHQAAVDALVAARQAAPTEANRLLLAQALRDQGDAAGTRP